MSRLLFLARGDYGAFCNINGRSILDGLPIDVHVFADRSWASGIAADHDPIRVDTVHWHDTAEICARAAKLHADWPFTGITTFDETLMSLAATLRETLQVQGLNAADTQRFRNKKLMKDLLGAAGVRVPNYAPCVDRMRVMALFDAHSRLVIKPIDGTGSKGVLFVNSKEELHEWYENENSTNLYEAEEYIDGVLYNVNSIVVDGRSLLTVCALYLPGMADINFRSGAPIVNMTLSPSQLRSDLEDFSIRVIEILGLKNGVTHLECFLSTSGDIVFCEIAARPGGGGIMLLIELLSNVHFGRELLLIESGHKELVDISPNSFRDGFAGLIGFRWPTNGFVKGTPTKVCFQENWIRHFWMGVEPGDFVAGCSHCTDLIGRMAFVSDSTDQFHSRLHEIIDRFNNNLAIEPV